MSAGTKSQSIAAPAAGPKQVPGAMPATRWTLVLRARGEGPAERRALGELCAIYWEPLRLMAEWKGERGVQSEDAVQRFFEGFVGRRDGFGEADPAKGRLRSFLIKSLENSINGERVRNGAEKRGDGAAAVSLEELGEHEEPAAGGRDCPLRAFDQAWAVAFLAEALERVRKFYVAKGQEEEWEALSPLLTEARAGAGESAAAARKLGKPPGTVSPALKRMRARYAEALREEVAETLADPTAEQVEEELEALMLAFRD